MNISNTGLSTRSKNVLLSQGITTVGALMKFYSDGIDIGSIRNMGAKSLREIKDFCEKGLGQKSQNLGGISKLELNHRTLNALLVRGIDDLGVLMHLSTQDINGMRELTTRDRLILKTIISTIKITSKEKVENESVFGIEVVDNISPENIWNKQLIFFQREINNLSLYTSIESLHIDIQRGHISELEFLFRMLNIYVDNKFNGLYGFAKGNDDINQLKSNNQLILLFIQKKLRRVVSIKNITKEEASILMQSLVIESDKWLLSRLLILFGYSSLFVLDQCHIVDQKNYSVFLNILRSVEGFPKKKYARIDLPSVVSNDNNFLRLLSLCFPINISENGYIENYVSEIPLIEKIYNRLKETGKPVSFDLLWEIENISLSSRSGLRIKIMRDKRFIVYGKLGYVGLIDWNYKIDEILAGSIPDATIALIKQYRLNGLSFSSISKMYSRLNKVLKMSSWKSNLLLSRSDLIISNNTARTFVDYSDLNFQKDTINLAKDQINRLLSGQLLSAKEIMELSLIVGLIDHRNFHFELSNYINDLLSLIRNNVQGLVRGFQRTKESVDYSFLESCLGIRLIGQNKSEMVYGVFAEMIEDGDLTYEEREVIAKWIDQGQISLNQVKQGINQGIINGKVNVDKQIACVFQHRGVSKLSEKLLIEDLKYLLFDISNIEEFVLKSKDFVLSEGFYLVSSPDEEMSSFTLNVVGQEFAINLKKSLWDNVTFEYSEDTNSPAITVNSSVKSKFVSLIEDSLLAYLLTEELMDPFNISKVRNRIHLKLKSQQYQLFE